MCIGAMHIAHRRARRDPENDYFFKLIPPATWRDYIASTVVVAAMAIFGLILWNLSDAIVLALVALLFALAALSHQMMMSHRYWMDTLVRRIQSEGGVR